VLPNGLVKKAVLAGAGNDQRAPSPLWNHLLKKPRCSQRPWLEGYPAKSTATPAVPI